MMTGDRFVGRDDSEKAMADKVMAFLFYEMTFYGIMVKYTISWRTFGLKDNKTMIENTELSKKNCILLNWIVLKESWHIIHKGASKKVNFRNYPGTELTFFGLFNIGSTKYAYLMQGNTHCYSGDRIKKIHELSGIEEAIFEGTCKLLEDDEVTDKEWNAFIENRKSKEGGRKGYAEFSGRIRTMLRKKYEHFNQLGEKEKNLKSAFYYIMYGCKPEETDKHVTEIFEEMKRLTFTEIFKTNRDILREYKEMIMKHHSWIDAAIITVENLDLDEK